MKNLALYLNFPFCEKKCNYCDFKSFAGLEKLMPLYLETIKKEIILISKETAQHKINSIFLGGGTPTLFDGDEIRGVLDLCFTVFELDPKAEITIESNPSTLTREKLDILLNAGVNRLSVGLQAMQDRFLKLLGRVHTFDMFVDSIRFAKIAGFENINVDILQSIPGQATKELLDTLNYCSELGVDHISMYSLKIEENTLFSEWLRSGEISVVDDELDRDMFYRAKSLLQTKGYSRYEISNFAKRGKECRHNLVYWKNNEYIGCGSNAHSFFKKARFCNESNIEDYISSINKGETVERETSRLVDKEEELFETVMLGLRLVSGIDKNEFRARFSNDFSTIYFSQIKELKNLGLLEESSSHIFCTEKGFDLHNKVLLHFLG